ncbi:MAG TPA: caspase family protein [Nitrososphaeraceae archaeon]|nr:caspase family protein [Nitrososphaeraceae archaeon]
MAKSEIQNSGNNSLRAILIGIDFYFPNSLPDGGSYLSLGGCVNDITRVENFLTGRLGMKSENIIKLTASSNPEGYENKPLESSEKWPTYENMVKAFKHVTESADSGDQVCIYYSGHGGRAKTNFPEIKGKDGIDEGLVPTDIGNPESSYLRDIEIAHLLKKMVDKGLVVTTFLDSCHSGGSTRGPVKAAVRGLSTVDTTDRPKDSLVASNDELISTWSQLFKTDRPATTRNIIRTSGWLPEARGYTLLAACRQHEYALEDQFPEVRSGVLTYYLLESLYSQRRNVLNYKMLYDTVIAKVHSRYSSQTPVLEGETDRMVFGSDYLKTESGANVIEVMDSEQVKLNAGIAQGVGKDAQFIIYPSNSIDLKANERLAIVKVSSVSASNCTAEIIERFADNESIKEGDKALLANIGPIEKKREVVLVNQDKNSLSPMEQKKYFDNVKLAVSSAGKGFVELVEMNEGEEENIPMIDYQIAINSKGEYEIWDQTGISIPNLNPPIRVTESNSAERVVSRLVHLARYNHVQQLNNYDDPLSSAVDKKLVVKLFQYQDNFKSKNDSELKPIESIGNVTTLKIREEVVARIYNNSQQPLNITALDLQPDWGISQIIPEENKGDFETLEPGKYIDFPFQTGLPEGYKEGKDIIKIFATVKPTQFRWLLLPSLDQPITRSAMLRGKGPTNSLEELFANLSEDTPSTKGLKPLDKTKSANVEWMTTQLEILINNRNS